FAQLVSLLESEHVDVVQPVDRGVLPKLPYLYPASTAITSRFLIECDGAAVHSRVHRVTENGETVIVKQATGDLAAREAAVLGLLDGDVFPRVLDAATYPGFSTCTLEDIGGEALSPTVWERIADTGAHRFLSGSLELLAALQAAGVRHRD